MSEVVRRDKAGLPLKGDMAGISFNGNFICVETWSGYSSSNRDFRGVQHFLNPGVLDSELGEAILDAMAHSRFVLPAPRTDAWQHPDAEFDLDLYDYQQGIERYKAWKDDLMARYGYKTQRALFKDMKNCSVERCNGALTIRPSHHAKLEGWEGSTAIENVILPADSTPAEIGAALRLAFSRCT